LAFGDDEIEEGVEVWLLLGDGGAVVGDDGGATETEADGDGFAGRVKREGIDTAGEGFGGLTELRMDLAAVVLVEEDAGTVFAVGEAVAFGEEAANALEGVHAGWDAVGFGPVLVKNALTLGIGDEDLVLAAAAAAGVAGPVLFDG
jgi:hypothetical protein